MKHLKIWIGSAAAVMLVSAGGLAAAKESFTLEFKYKEGQVLKYKRVNNLEISSVLFSGGKMAIDQEMVQVQRVDKVRKDGLIEVALLSESVVMKIDNEVVPGNQTLSGMPSDLVTGMVFTPTGRIESVSALNEVAPENKAQVENLFDNMKNRGFHFLEKPVQIGDSWSQEIVQSIEIPNLGTVDVNMVMNYTFEIIESYEGFRCARVSIKGEGNGTIGEGLGTLEVTQDGYILHAVEEGFTLFTKQKEIVDMSLVTPQGPVEIKHDHLTTETYIKETGDR